MRRNCLNCEYSYLSEKDEPCKNCKNYNKWEIKTLEKLLLCSFAFVLIFGIYVLIDFLL